MIANSSDAGFFSDLEHCFLYELQHIPIKTVSGVDAVEKYFWEAEFNYFLEKGRNGKFSQVGREALLLYVAICSLEQVMKDIKMRRPKAILYCNGRDLSVVMSELVELTKDYNNLLGKAISDYKKKLPKILIVKHEKV